MRTSFHHQPEAQHPKSPAIETPAGRLPHLFPNSDRNGAVRRMTLSAMYGRRLRCKGKIGHFSEAFGCSHVFGL